MIKKYHEYKESNVEWLKEIPSHWGLAKIRSFTFDSSKNISIEDIKNKLWFYYDIPTVQEKGDGKIELGNNIDSNKTAILGEEILISKLNPRKGTVVLTRVNELPIICSTEFVVFNTNEVNRKYLYYLLSSDVIADVLNASVKSVTRSHQRVNPKEIQNLLAPIPTTSEQIKIARFLDIKLQNVDNVISESLTLIKLLEEKRQSMITDTVTKGLNLKIKMKDSGIDWIGKIPDHWEVKKIKHLSNVRRGASPRPIDNPVYFDEEGQYAWVRIADVSASDMYLTQTTQRLSELGSSLSVKMEPGSMFLSIAGTVGKPCITNIQCCIHDGFVYFPNYKQNIKYLYFIFDTGEPYKGLGKMGTQLNLNTDTVGGIHIPVPPIYEQGELVRYIERKVNEYNELIRMIKEQIQKLKEYRQSLIYEAVTGKIDVRDFELVQ